MINTALCDIVACALVRADCRSDGDRRCRADADREQDHRPNHGYDGKAPIAATNKKRGCGGPRDCGFRGKSPAKRVLPTRPHVVCGPYLT